MKLVRFGEPGQEKPGVVDQEGRIRDVSARISDWTGEALDPARLTELSSIDIAAQPIVPADVRLGSPVPTPGKIVCVGLNYADHAAETGFELPSEPLVFFKSPTAICGPTDPIRIPKTANAVDWEVELACVIGRSTIDAREDDAIVGVAGLAVANDVTERKWQFERGGQWSKAKSADTFAPLGPWLVTPDELTDLGGRRIWLRKNDVVRQDTVLAQMIFTVPQIIAHLSEFMRLMPGDVILTGTPSGVAYNKSEPDYLRPGDLLRCGIDGLGEQHTKVVL
ncbi:MULTISPECIES: fumarylacetoacetate hydrolase family protein [Bradyrhizobium]|uniref:Fumarylacetoacetate hydrolase family protein n=1 Tax=Bradyrhizobium elkanii TaxID=29448 RepID=A0A4U6RH67_BRAEL|nr:MULTISPECIES: fumarylacetoacetate hydrolase family protein [Bradyrhizobium]MTV11815.1 FAA hydrolase family protein [Bradyrhizobium sp. BR2003]TKV73647.1 fumarylacetoacetate hydrolase family protein [Bradyrhizobium elkanii]